ncbi:MAG: MgtC/SapB family protein [Dehalococcoidia bacterium]|nr:MgtC/SapB family protein [Dehalococcoidia bacterium]
MPFDIDIGGDPVRLAVALGIGLLLGIERERRMAAKQRRSLGGVRTFALVALLGGLAMVVDHVVALAVAGAFVAGAALVGYALSDPADRGLTTETALVVAFLLGALAMEEPELAAAMAVVVTILLAARSRLHAFVSQTLTESEVHDGLLFAAAALVVLPLVPDREVGPYDVFNPFAVWRLVVIVMAISAAGYVAVRLLGPRFGLPVAGLAGGFVSSSATIASMGARAKAQPGLATPAVAGAVFSTVATVLQMLVVLGTTSSPTLRELLPAMVGAGIAAAAYGGLAALRASRAEVSGKLDQGHAFDLKTAVIFAATITAVLFVSAFLNEQFGQGALVLATAVAGFADTHSAAASVASLVAAGKVSASDAAVPILAAFTTNTLTKAVLAYVAGGRRFAEFVWPGLLAVLAGAWALFAAVAPV